MTDTAAQQPTTRSTFPPPPPWWRLYPPDPPPQLSTTHSHTATTSTTSTLLPLPTAFGLPIFTPPLPPATPATPYVLFNQTYTTSPLLPPLPPDTPQLFTTEPDGRINYAKQLSTLSASLLTHWLALLQSLATAQPTTAALLAALSHCYTNATHLLARLRRHQAVQHVLLLTRDQLQRRREKRERLEAEVAACKALLARYGMEWAEGDDSVRPRRRSVDEMKEAGSTEAEVKVHKHEVEEALGGVKRETALNVKGEVDTESGVEGSTSAVEEEEEEEERQQALRLQAFLDSMVDTGDY